MIIEAIRNILTSNIDINTAVSGRIYAHVATLNTDYPLIIYSGPSTTPTPTKNNSSEIDIHDIDINIYGKTALETGIISELIEEELNRKSGTFSTHIIQSTQITNRQEIYESENNIYRVILSYVFRECKT